MCDYRLYVVGSLSCVYGVLTQRKEAIYYTVDVHKMFTIECSSKRKGKGNLLRSEEFTQCVQNN